MNTTISLPAPGAAAAPAGPEPTARRAPGLTWRLPFLPVDLRFDQSSMLYAAKCYWPGVTHTDLQQAADRARAGPGTPSSSVAYLGALLFAADDLALCLFCGPTRAAVIQASDRLRIPRERLMEPIWLPRASPPPEGAQQWPGGPAGLARSSQRNSPRFEGSGPRERKAR